MKFLILNADTPTGFYLINRFTLRGDEIDAIIVGDADGDDFIHPETHYHNPQDIDLYTFKGNNYDGIFYVCDTHRLYDDFMKVTYSLFFFNIPIIAIFDWEIFNGVKRGNFPVSTATPTKPDNFRGISKVWIKDTILRSGKTSKLPYSVIVTPTVLSPFQLTKTVRKSNYLAKKLWECLENFKTGTDTPVNKGDLRVIYDIIHNTDVAAAAIDLFEKQMSGYYMLSSNVFLRFNEILQIFFGRLIGTNTIKVDDLPIVEINKRRSIENYDTTIDMVKLWSNVIYYTWFPLEEIFDDVTQNILAVNNDYELVERVMMHLIL